MNALSPMEYNHQFMSFQDAADFGVSFTQAFTETLDICWQNNLRMMWGEANPAGVTSGCSPWLPRQDSAIPT